MISSQLLWDLGFKGACIILSEDYRSNRHIRATDKKTLCGRNTVKQKDIMVDGRFKGYVPGSSADVWGFYGSGRCKVCLTKYLRFRLGPEGKKRLHKARAKEVLRRIQAYRLKRALARV